MASRPGGLCSQDLKNQLQDNGRRPSLGDRSAFQRPADVSQAGGRSKASEGCKPSRRGSVDFPAATSGHRRSLDSQRPGTESSGKDPTWESSSSQSIPRSSAGPLITSPSPNLLTDATAKAAPAEAGLASQEPRERRAAALQRYKQKRKVSRLDVVSGFLQGFVDFWQCNLSERIQFHLSLERLVVIWSLSSFEPSLRPV